MIKHQLAQVIKDHLTFPSVENLQQRGIADKIEDACNQIIKDNFSHVTPPRSRKSTEDITIGSTYVDHKTSDLSLKFKMPNLVSVDTLRKLDRQLLYNFVVYNSQQRAIVDTFVLDLYELNWDHLSIQNLGTGQLQITNMERFLKSPHTSMTPSQWRQQLQLRVTEFYDQLVIKTRARQQQWKNWS